MGQLAVEESVQNSTQLSNHIEQQLQWGAPGSWHWNGSVPGNHEAKDHVSIIKSKDSKCKNSGKHLFEKDDKIIHKK